MITKNICKPKIGLKPNNLNTKGNMNKEFNFY